MFLVLLKNSLVPIQATFKEEITFLLNFYLARIPK